MKIKLLLLAFILCPAFVFSQIKIRGKVLDRETQKPVSNVIIHSSGKISMTNDKGEYDFEINQPEVVYFRHLSYNLLKIQSDSLQNNDAVYLTPNITELDEVVISSNATDLLSEAIHNLVTNFQKKKTKTHYLTHIKGNVTTGGEKEIYALIEASLSNIDIKGRKSLEWDLNFTQLDRQSTNEESFIVNGNIVTVRFFEDNLKFPVATKDTTAAKLEIYENNEEELIFKIHPKHIDNNHYSYSLWTINRKDTTLTKILTQSYSNSDVLTEQEYKGVNYSIVNHFHTIEFVKNTSELYYLDKIQHLMTYKIFTDAPYEITFKVLTHAVKNVSDNDIKKKKKILRPHEDVLFKSKLPDSPGFWKKYVLQ
ncbi:MAG: carboxypeptidase-like regulatory domain-containing protein [Bacteroidales bacterium]|jgi:hypothetical protein|nr:carboxypeptidase-like regulatory domain-containing protein [Bacteroidales bacterium]